MVGAQTFVYAATHSGEMFATLDWAGGAGAVVVGDGAEVVDGGADVLDPGRH